MKPKHQRLVFIGASVLFLCVAVLMTLRAFRDNLVFFYSPSELASHPIPAGRTVRIGGLVEEGSIKRPAAGTVEFSISDGKAALPVTFHGMPPNLFREGQGVIAEGTITDAHMDAKSILAKHDEKYMPREVVDALKRNGQWKGQ